MNLIKETVSHVLYESGVLNTVTFVLPDGTEEVATKFDAQTQFRNATKDFPKTMAYLKSVWDAFFSDPTSSATNWEISYYEGNEEVAGIFQQTLLDCWKYAREHQTPKIILSKQFLLKTIKFQNQL